MLQFSINKFNRFVLTLPGRHDLVSTLKRRRMSTGFKREPQKMVKHTQTIRRLLPNRN